MMGFNLRLLAGTARWVAPTAVLLLWVLLSLGSPVALSNAATMFTGFVVWATWSTMAMGSVDDDPHRDLAAARAGSSGRLHLERMATIAGVGTCAALVASLVVVASAGQQQDRGLLELTLWSWLLLTAAVLLGTGFGTLLHRPIFRHGGLAFLASVLGIAGLILLPPAQSVLRDYDTDQPGTGLALFAAALTFAALMSVVSSRVAQIRAR